MIRKIDTKEYNLHLVNGVEKHKPTSIAPINLMIPFSKEEEQELKKHHIEVEAQLIEILGQPFFSETGFMLYNGDCMEFMEKLNASSFRFNLTITSPPYNIGKEYEVQMLVEDYIDWCSKWMKYIYSVTTDDGLFWLNVGYLDVPNKGLCVPIPYLLWDKSDFYFIQEVVWKYGAGVQTKRRLSPRNEKWLFYAKNSESYTFNLDDIRDPNVKYPNQKKDGKYRCNPLGKNPSDVWEFPKVTTGTNRSSKERTGHPAQFPLAIVDRLVKACSNKFDVILDPFAGSCSTGIAAIGLGRLFVGFEVRKDYCELAAKRVAEFHEERIKLNCQSSIF
jgi:adenine-specific DNA-methyltransferase